MQVDSHQHFWKYDVNRNSWITDEMKALKRDFLPADLLPELRANGMSGCVAVQADQSEQETQFLLDLANQCDAIKGVVGWVDLLSPDVADRLQYFSQFKKLCGIRHVVQSEPDDGFMLRPEFCRGIKALQEFDLTYDILIYSRQLPAALELVTRFPEQPFVIDHIAKPRIAEGKDPEWRQRMPDLAALPNVAVKLSGMVTEANWASWTPADLRPFVASVVDWFGAGRLMFGSDWPVCLLATPYDSVVNGLEEALGPISPGDAARIFGLNAVSVYRLRGR